MISNLFYGSFQFNPPMTASNSNTTFKMNCFYSTGWLFSAIFYLLTYCWCRQEKAGCWTMMRECRQLSLQSRKASNDTRSVRGTARQTKTHTVPAENWAPIIFQIATVYLMW